MQQHWSEARHYLKREWPKLTDVDLEEIDGQYDRLIGKIRELYNGRAEITQEGAIKTRLQKYFNGLDSI